MALAPHMAFTIAFMIGIVPAITLIYYTLKNYERYLEDKLLYFSILTGLFLGILVSFFHLAISTQLPNLNLVTLALVIISFALFENIVKIVFVQRQRFAAGFETTYYGATFGLIVGASITMGRTYEFFSRDLVVVEMIGILLFAFAIILMNGSMGAWLGYGLYKQDLKWSFASAILVSLPFNFLVFWWYLLHIMDTLGNFEPAAGDLIWIGTAFIYAGCLFLYSFFKIMPDALPEKQRRERLREARRRTRDDE